MVFCVGESRRTLTNTAFLIGAYLFLKHDMGPKDLSRRFAWLDSRYVEAYCNVTYYKANCRLHLIDCWRGGRGLAKGPALGWVRYAASGYKRGELEIDIDEYRQYDSPANGNVQILHQVVPGKLIAFQGREDLGRSDYINT